MKGDLNWKIQNNGISNFGKTFQYFFSNRKFIVKTDLKTWVNWILSIFLSKLEFIDKTDLKVSFYIWLVVLVNWIFSLIEWRFLEQIA